MTRDNVKTREDIFEKTRENINKTGGVNVMDKTRENVIDKTLKNIDKT